MVKTNILFVCGRNKFRSPTAEKIYKRDDRLNVRSAGLSEKSPHVISTEDIKWADLIIVFEPEYKTRIQEMFYTLTLPNIEIVDIPDIYHYMDPELITIIKEVVDVLIKEICTE